MEAKVIEKDFPHDRVVVRTPVGIEIIFGHDANGNVHSVANPRGYVIRPYFYDALRLAKEAFREAQNTTKAQAQK